MSYFHQIKKEIKRRPKGIVVLSLLFMLIGVLSFLISFDFYYQEEYLMNTLFKGKEAEVVINEITFFCLGLFFIITGKSLWKLEEWSRVLVYWLSVLSIPSSIYYIGVAIFSVEKADQMTSIILSVFYCLSHVVLIFYLRQPLIKNYFSLLTQKVMSQKIENQKFIDLRMPNESN